MDTTTNHLEQLAHENEAKLIEIRRFLHQHPELSGEEQQTAAYIAKILRDLGLEVQEGIAETGIVGILHGKEAGPTIALRADTDALPLEEKTNAVYQSLYPGKMHACGHDSHVTMALGAAIILSSLKNSLKGTVKFIFQPAEEAIGGAERMIQQGVLDDVDAIIGGHVTGNANIGQILYRSGPIMASSDIINLKITGIGGHAAQPHKTIDPVIIGSEIVCSLQKLVSRRTDPLEPVVLSICHFAAGDTFNVIPREALLEGTVRTLNPAVRKTIAEQIETTIKAITESYGATYDLQYHFGYPVVINDRSMTDFFRKSASKVIGENNVLECPKPSMGGEDFAYYLEKVPGTFVWIGIRNEAKGLIHDIHHPAFDIDESVLALGAKVYSQVIIDYLAK